eukprot:Opistho-2@7797
MPIRWNRSLENNNNNKRRRLLMSVQVVRCPEWSLRFNNLSHPVYVNERSRTTTRIRPTAEVMRGYALWQRQRQAVPATATHVTGKGKQNILPRTNRSSGSWILNRIERVVLVALHDFVLTSAVAKRRIVEAGAPEALQAILAASNNAEVVLWAARVVYQLCG